MTNALAARAQGFDGRGVTVGVVDSGINRDHPALTGRVIANLVYVDAASNDLSVDDKLGHGTDVAQILAGKQVGTWPGGIAPGAQLVSSRLISQSSTDSTVGMDKVGADLIARGAKIMNNSWGGVYWMGADSTAAYAQQFQSFVIDHGGLVVFAAGNDSRPRPSDMAALPSKGNEDKIAQATQLARGWLVAAALDTSNPTQLASYSNACGVAMDYCLAAPGNVIATGSKDKIGAATTYYVIKGTSFAAPQVSGAAALVWQAFPYFSNDLVRQTLLGTAKDIGVPGVDATFGRGLLDAGAAVRGPARLDWGDVSVAFDGYTSTWSNPITGNGGLTKQGTGTLVIDAAGGYGGATRVEGGTLQVNTGLTATSGSFIAAGAQLQLRNRAGLNGSVDNRGALALYGNSVHSLAGDYTQAADARLMIEVGTQLSVAGKATLNNGALYVMGIAPGYVSSTRSVFLRAQQLQGSFGSLTSAPGVFLDAKLGYSATDAWLDINRLDVTVAAQSLGTISAASVASATRVEGAFQQIDAQQGGASGGISSGFIQGAGAIQGAPTAAAAAASLRSLSGELHAAAAAMTFDAIDMNRRALSSRFADLAEQPRLIGGWSSALGGAGQGSYAGTGFDVSGWMLGSDYRLGGNGVAGFAFGETRASGSLAAMPDQARDRQTQGQFYLGGMHGNGYLLGQLGFGRYERRMDRGLLLGESYRGVSSDYAGDFFAANLEAGHRLGLAGASLTPYVGTQYTRIRNQGFSEQGADGFGLMTRDSLSTRTQALAGLRLERAWHGWNFRGYGEWQQALSTSGLAVEASFVGAEAWSPLSGMQPARSGGLFGIGADTWLSRDTKLSLGYDQRFGPRGDARTVSIRIETEF